jgi:hypothetical protein
MVELLSCSSTIRMCLRFFVRVQVLVLYTFEVPVQSPASDAAGSSNV